MKTFLHFYWGSLLFTLLALITAGFVGHNNGNIPYAIFITIVLGVLEISLSFDNAVVNAKTLATMDPIWQRRFLTWGIAIAVFGMRIVFPLLIVLIASGKGPIEAIKLAIKDPVEYEAIIVSKHHEIAAFGGAFLLMVGLRYFFDHEKEVHWVKIIETPLVKYGKLYLVEAMLILVMLVFCAYFMPIHAKDIPKDFHPELAEHVRFLLFEFQKRLAFLAAGVAGLVIYALVQWIEILLDKPESHEVTTVAVKSGLSGFLYLEVLDASFSFDGVIGAFALSNNIFIIALGLGIGAMFVRSMTVMLVEKGTISMYRYLEHGAFWAIIALGVCMFMKLFFHIPEVIVGVVGAALIGLSLYSSILLNKKEAKT